MKNSTLIAIAALAACTTTVNAQQLRHTRLHSAAPFAIKANNSAQKKRALKNLLNSFMSKNNAHM